MAIAPAAAFMSEVEDDRQSVTSVATSIWGGVDEPNINELWESRKAANVLRRRLMAEYNRIKALDVEDFADDFPECDELRFNFGQAIVRHVNLARQNSEGGTRKYEPGTPSRQSRQFRRHPASGLG